MCKISCLLFCFIATLFSFSQTEKEYNNGHGGKIKLPLGDLSFADKLISFVPGKPAPMELNANPKDAVGLPDFNEQQVTGFVSLGIGGELVLAFTNNALVNIDGPDLYIFEVGRYIEETILYVSKNGKNWKNVGKIGGGNALVDIGDSTAPGEIFSYIKLQDAKTSAKNGDRVWPGADIDAVAAIGSAKQLSLNSLYLFNTNESKIKPEAKKDLDAIIKELKENPVFNIVIEGHTDSIGNKMANKKLSENRALSIKTFFVNALPEFKTRIKTQGYADEIPVATNSTQEGREKNRRVEVFFIPVKK
ncbi:MAG: OmpA family protein [Bacteroidetes bacterium]|nr:OmpA family protein [Bacteroidota bacterium]